MHNNEIEFQKNSLFISIPSGGHGPLDMRQLK